VAEPATRTTARCHLGFAVNTRGLSSGAGSWNGFMPAMRTYPPKGRAFTPYSVSPRR
jgi:hypothetical protein